MDTLSQLTGAAKVYLDTNCFIYFLEKHPIFFPVILPVFEAAMNGDYQIVTLTPISLNVLDKAAAIRAAHKTALPDAIHIATAIEAHCDVFMTNDRKMKGFNGLRPVYLS